jgi:quercetin dioxygenase-like cupin family protein
MKRFLFAIGVVTLLTPTFAFAGDTPATPAGQATPATQATPAAQPTPAAQVTPPVEHRYYTPADIKWVDGPPSLPKGAKFAVLEGDPTAPGPFAMRISVPAGYKIPPHWHPAMEHVTVISGSFFMGLGDTWDESKGHEMPAGSFGYMPQGVKHYAWTKVETVVQVHGIGPWGITYVNASDDPRNQKQATKY